MLIRLHLIYSLYNPYKIVLKRIPIMITKRTVVIYLSLSAIIIDIANRKGDAK